MTYLIEARTLTSQDTAVVRSCVPNAQLHAWLIGVYRELDRYLTDLGVRVCGPPFARCAGHGDVVDVEAGYPVPGPVPDKGRITASRLPGGRAAATVHHGSCTDLDPAERAVADWLTKRGLVAAGPPWDVYYTNLAAQPDDAVVRTDVVAPYRST
ncbi:GyrI-like domain-containing protein [Actinoplanes sp. NPDC048967]|uniref:GyrI-like domain-containing protein n=1 Tax=Actinoplanes sp. NPDC048967 TaxID=3155269 RepID=UPI00341017E8